MKKLILLIILINSLFIACSDDETTPAPLTSEPTFVDYSGAYLGTRYVNYYATQSGALLDSSTFVDTIFVFKHKVNSDSFLTWGYDNKYQESVNWGRLQMDGTFKSTGKWYDSNLKDSFTQQHNHRIIDDTFHEVISTARTNFRWYGEGVFVKMP
jgi:hypothetical protein